MSAAAEAVTLDAIETAARAFAGERERLADKVYVLEQALAKLRRSHMGALRRAVERSAAAEQVLRALVQAAPHLFARPRTLVLHGIKVGWVKGKGTIEITDPARTVALIRRHLGEQADALIRVTEMPHRPALAQLSVAELKRIGCTVTDAGDCVVVKPVDGDVQKLIDRLFADAADALDGAAATTTPTED